MTDRDTFAAAALTGMLAHYGLAGPGRDHDVTSKSAAGWAYRYADAMLWKRKQMTSKPQPCTAVLSTDDVVVYTPTNHDAAPAARAPADSCVPRRAVDCDSDGTDKADPLTRDCGTGNTNARLAALEELSALDQKLELEYGLTGNPMIKAQERTRPTHATQPQGSVQGEGSISDSGKWNEPVAWHINGSEYDTGCEYEYATLERGIAEAATAEGCVVVPLYRHPQTCPHVRGTVTQHCSLNFTLTDEEREIDPSRRCASSPPAVVPSPRP